MNEEALCPNLTKTAFVPLTILLHFGDDWRQRPAPQHSGAGRHPRRPPGAVIWTVTLYLTDLAASAVSTDMGRTSGYRHYQRRWAALHAGRDLPLGWDPVAAGIMGSSVWGQQLR
jgi:hypothetical protein